MYYNIIELEKKNYHLQTFDLSIPDLEQVLCDGVDILERLHLSTQCLNLQLLVLHHLGLVEDHTASSAQ